MTPEEEFIEIMAQALVDRVMDKHRQQVLSAPPDPILDSNLTVRS